MTISGPPYLIALESRLRMIWRTRAGSPMHFAETEGRPTMRDWLEDLDRVGRLSLEVARHRADLEPAEVRLGGDEQVVDDVGEVGTLLHEEFDHLHAVVGAEVGGLLEELREPHYRREGSAYLVGDRGDQLVLRSDQLLLDLQHLFSAGRCADR